MATVWTTKRLWIPFVLAALCLLVASFCGPVLTVVLMITALGLVIDGATLLWSRSGGMAGHRQQAVAHTIDHVLAGERAGVRRVATDELPRTDHRAFLAELVLPAE